MHSQATIDSYRKRINKVLNYIDRNLGEKLDLETLSAVSHFSPYHFHRIMKAHLNEPLGSYIIRIRLENAAILLLQTDLPLNDIAYKIGYDTPSSFTKAFKNRFGISPRQYRHSNAPIRIEKDHEFIGVSHDDPHITETEKLRYDACLTIKQNIDPEGEIGVKSIDGGKYAVFRHKGPYKNLQRTYDLIYKQWLTESGEQIRDLPCFENYLNSPDTAKPEELLTEIYIPIQ